MRHVFTIPFFLMLCACNPGFLAENDPRLIRGVDPVFDHYVTAYKTYKGSELSYDIPIQFADLKDNTVGLCTRWSNGYRQIEIDRDYWKNVLTKGEKLNVIFHELGHCDLNRNHTTTLSSDGRPTSIMYPYVFNLYPTSVARYVIELFNNRSIMPEITLGIQSNCVNDIIINNKEHAPLP